MQPPQEEATAVSSGQARLISLDESTIAAFTNKEDSVDCGSLIPQPHQNFSVCPYSNFQNPIPGQAVPSFQQIFYEVGDPVCTVIHLLTGFDFGYGFQQAQPLITKDRDLFLGRHRNSVVIYVVLKFGAQIPKFIPFFAHFRSNKPISLYELV